MRAPVPRDEAKHLPGQMASWLERNPKIAKILLLDWNQAFVFVVSSCTWVTSPQKNDYSKHV